MMYEDTKIMRSGSFLSLQFRNATAWVRICLWLLISFLPLARFLTILKSSMI